MTTLESKLGSWIVHGQRFPCPQVHSPWFGSSTILSLSLTFASSTKLQWFTLASSMNCQISLRFIFVTWCPPSRDNLTLVLSFGMCVGQQTLSSSHISNPVYFSGLLRIRSKNSKALNPSKKPAWRDLCWQNIGLTIASHTSIQCSCQFLKNFQLQICKQISTCSFPTTLGLLTPASIHQDHKFDKVHERH